MYRCNKSCCFPNILDDMVLENMNLSEDKIGLPPLWSDFLSSVAYTLYQQCIFQPNVNIICTLDLELFNFSDKMT
jgi:hypothetical protein